MNRYICSVLALFGLISRGVQAAALDMPVEACDIDSSKTLSRSELSACLRTLDAAIQAAAPKGFAECDRTPDGALDERELTECYIALDPLARKAAAASDAVAIGTDAAQELIEDFGEPVPAAIAQGRLEQRTIQAAKEVPLTIGSTDVIIGRKLTDAVDPRSSAFSVPLILSFTDDRDGGGDAFVALGAVSYLTASRDLSKSWSRLLILKLDADMTTKTDPSESSLTFSAPVQWSWINPDDPARRWLDDVQVSLEPKYVTDRDLSRDVYELALPISMASRRFANAGQVTYFGGNQYNRLSRYQFYWQPTVSVTAGHIADAGGNAKLAALKRDGDFLLLAPAAAMKLMLPFAQGRFSLSGSYTHRFDVDQGLDHGFTTASIQYDFTKTFAFTLTYRHGRKPPDFSATDDVLIGFGFSQFPD